MQEERIKYLFQRHLDRACTLAEREELAALALEQQHLPLVKELIASAWETTGERYDLSDERAGEIFGKIINNSADSRESVVGSRDHGMLRSLWKKIAVAASVVAVLMTGWWLWRDKTTDDGPQTTVVQTNDVKAPDKSRASIKLADGRVIYLDSSDNGELATVNGVAVIKSDEGVVKYSGQSSVVSGPLEYNTLTNPRGSKVINMTLADGSRVWLNAGSSVTYPVAFVGDERKVEIKGEGYFEVAHNAKMPFIVSNGDVQVKVLGTHFNVNAYEDEADVKVTLLEGSVKVQSSVDSRQTSVLRPGEQAISIGNGQLAISKDVDLEAVMAWKNGLFSFQDMDLQSVMRQVARWYDVEIVYQGKLPDEEFVGSASRQENVSALLKILEGTGKIKFRIEGKKIIVMP